MANVIDILIKAKDQVSGVVDDITTSLGGLGDGAKEAESVSSDAFGNFMDKANETMLGVAGAIYVAKEAFKVLGEVYNQTVGKTLEIAGEIEELSRVSGDAPENMSLLRLEAEKASVPFDDLYKAMENLNKNGVAPTIDNLIDIAQEYVNLQDPIAQAKLLTENFGAAGDEIAPMLEAIAGGITAVDNAGLIFTQEEIDQAKDYKTAVAELGLAWEGLATTIGMAVIPALTDSVGEVKNWLGEIGLLAEYMGALNDAADSGRITPTEWFKGVSDMLTLDLAGGANSVSWLTEQINELNGAVDKSIPTFDEYRRAQQDSSEMMEAYGSNTKRIGGLIKDTTESFKKQNLALQLQSDLLQDLEGAQLKYNIAVEVFKTDIAGQLYQGLVDAGLNQQQMEESLGALDSFFGTSYTVKYKMEAELDDLLQQLIDNPEAFAPAAQSFVDTFAPLQESAIAAQAEIKKIADDIANIPGVVDIEFNITVNGSLPNVGGGRPRPGYNPVVETPTAAGGMVQAAASGLAASLPYYWVGERGPEPFFPSVDGRIVSNTQAMSALRGGGANASDIANAVKQGVKEAMRDTGGGKVYNLTMPTSNNPADIKMAFELMEAWA